jgi:hypothetical protein
MITSELLDTLPPYQKAIVLGAIHKKSGGNKSDNKSDMQNKPIRKTTSLYSIQGALKSRSDSRWISLPSFSHMRKAFADGAWAAHRAMYGGDMKYRLVETAPDFKIIDEWESPSVSVKTPTANRKPEATYEELQEQLDRLAEQKESNHKVSIAIGRMFCEAKEQRDRLAEALWSMLNQDDGSAIRAGILLRSLGLQSPTNPNEL